jgi:hypothetical protein
MAEPSWPTSEVTWEHLQKLVSKRYMIAAKFATCLVSVEPASPALAKGHVVVCATFYEQGFGVPSHWFLRTLLRSYGLELHHLTPLGILHMGAFMTLCEAYIGIEPHLDLWNHFFGARLRQGSDAGAASLGSVDILVHSRPAVDSYFFIPLPDPPIGWQKAWFLVNNDSDAPLPTFMCGHPIPHPNWEYGVSRSDLHRLQPLLEVIWGLLQKGLTGEEILQTFINHGVHLLRQREMVVRVFPGPSRLIHPSYTRVSNEKINTQVEEALVPEDSARQEAHYVCSE